MPLVLTGKASRTPPPGMYTDTAHNHLGQEVIDSQMWMKHWQVTPNAWMSFTCRSIAGSD
ncbi:hypothetical protein KCP74_09345 [Salmonella enterica subsp. enterica]|nr:hypothetical protein KCP74_09345 [Salmonella enterica subsp. enterica]